MEGSRLSLAIIGAGISGIITAKHASAENYEITMFEKKSSLGGVWSSQGFAWPHLETNITKFTMDLLCSRWLMIDDLYPSKKEVHDYIENIAKGFDLEKYIKFNSCVSLVKQNPDLTFTVQWIDGDGNLKEEKFNRVIVAVGKSNKIDYGGFEIYRNKQNGCLVEIIHAGEYQNTDIFKNKKVMVLGHGHSAAQLSSEISKVADSLINVFRNPHFILQKNAFSDKYQKVIPTEIILSSTRKQRKMNESLSLVQSYLSLIKLFSSLTQQNSIHPALFIDENSQNMPGLSIADHYLNDVKEGKFHIIKTFIEKIEGKKITLANNEAFDIDILLLGTGYYEDLSFLDKELQNILEYNPKIKKRPLDLDISFVYNRKIKNLAFVGAMASSTIFSTNNFQALVALQYLKNQDNYEEFYKRLENIKTPIRYSDLQGYNDILATEVGFLPDFDFVQKIDEELYEYIMDGPYLIQHYFLKEKNYATSLWDKNAEFIKNFNRNLKSSRIL